MPKQTTLDTINRLIAEENSGGAARTRSSGTISRIDQLIADEEERERQQEEEQRQRQQAARNASSASEVMDLVRSYGDYGLERRAAEMPRPVKEKRRAGNALTPEMEAEYQRRNGVNRAPTAYQTYMMQVANSQPAQEETRSTDELRRDMNRQNRIARGTERMAADMAGQGLRDQSLLFNPTYTSNLRTMGRTMEAQQGKAAAATNLYQTLSVQRREREEREKYAALMQNPDFAAKSQGDPAIGNKASATALSPAERLYQSIYNHGREKTNAKDRNAAEFVSDEEAGIFFYLWNTQGPRAAQSYYNDYVDNRASQRRAEEAQAQAEAFGHRDILGSSAESVIANAASGVGLVDMAWQNIARSVGLTDKNKPLNYYSSAQLPGLVSDAIRKGAADEIAAIFPKVKIGKGGNAVNVASFLYETGMSMADSGVAILLNRIGIPEPLTLANMGAAAGTRAIRDARERGASDGQALAFGFSSAIMEALFEKISLDRILEPSYAQTTKAHLLNALKQSFTEGSEEVMTTLANTAADMLIMGDKAELYAIQRQLMEQGVSEKEALSAAFKQWGTGIVGDLLGGMISGFGMGGAKEVGTGLSVFAQGVRQDVQTARALTDYQNAQQAAPQITPQQTPAAPAQQRQLTAREQNPLRFAMNKAQNGETVTGNDAKAILNDPQAVQTLRDAGVLAENIRPGAEGRTQIQQAVQALAEQYAEGRSALGISDSFANTPPVAQERTTPPLPHQTVQEQQERAPTPPLPQNAQNEAQGPTLRVRTQEEQTPRQEALRIRENEVTEPTRQAPLTIRGANATVEENRQEESYGQGQQTETAAAAGEDDFRSRAETAAEGARRSYLDRIERSSGLGRVLQDLRNYRVVRGAESRASEVSRIRNQAEAGNQRDVSALDYGISNGSAEQSAKELDNTTASRVLGRNWDRAVAELARQGVTLKAMTGQLKKEDGTQVRAFFSGDGKTIVVQADHPKLSWNQLLDHEDLHRRIKADKNYRKAVEDALLADRKLQAYLPEIIDRYAQAYAAADPGLSSDDVIEELLADYRAGFDMLDPLGMNPITARAAKRAAKDIKAVEQKGVKQTGENRHGQPTAYSEDGTKATVDDVAVASNIVDTITEDPRPFDYMSADKNSIETFPDWAQNFNKRGGENAQQIVDAIRQFTEAMIASDVIMGYVPVGSVAYNKTGPLRKNIEYVFSFDMDASCPRTFQFLNYRNELQRIAGRPLTYAESIQLIELMRAYGQQIPCSYCYVENKRVLLANNYLNWFGFYDRVVGAETDEEARKLMYGYNEKKDSLSKGAESELARWRKADKNYRPKASEVWLARQTAKNSVFNWLDQRNEAGLLSRKAGKNKIIEAVCKEFKVTDKAAKAEITDFVGNWVYDRDMKIPHNYEIVNDTNVSEVDQRALNMHRTAMAYANSASSARTVDNYMPYTDQIWNVTAEQKRRIMAQGGIRKHSSNDFRMDYVQDYFMFFADLAAGGWTGHTYTKNVDYVKIFGRTGDRINVSVAFTDENGQVRENMQEGMGWKDAQQLRKDYAENVGVMAMVTSDAQLSYALNNDWIDMIIPFHASGLDKSVWYNIRMWQDYTSKQNERWYTRGRMEAELKDAGVTVPKEASSQEITELYRKTFNIKMITNKDGLPVKPHFLPGSYEVNGQTVPGHNNDKEKYFQLCKEYGVVPRFQGILVDDGEGNMIDVTEHRNYMKLVKETARTDVEQKPIQFNFDQVDPALGMTPFEYAMQRMEEEARNGGYANTAEDKFGIVKEFQEEYLGKNIPLPTGLDENGKPLPGNLTDLLTDRAIAFREGLMEMQNQAAQEQAQVVEESQQEGKASTEIDAPYNRTALLTEDTVDRWLKDYASESSPKYAQAYITRMSPDQFLKLTTSRTGRLVVSSQTGPMEAEKLIDATQKQPLQLIISNGEVVGHEGRHRATALDRANVRSIPVLVFDSSNKNSKTDVPEMVLQGQDFGSSRSYDRVTLENMIPLSYENRDRIVQEYGKQDAFERSAEKIGLRRTMKFSLEPVEAINPISGKWQRGATYDEVKAAHPTLFELAADEAETRNPTQINGTVKTYRKIYDMLKQDGFDGTILDASSGLGYGTRAGRDEYGYDVDDIEPFPDKSYSPKYTDYSKLKKTYDVVISNAVLNVIPQDLRDAMVVKIGEMLNPGGRAFINVRGTDVKNAKSKVAINEDQMEYFIADSGSYQKGFRQAELVDYLKDALGDGFTVTPNSSFGGVSAVVTKNGGSASIEIDPEVAAQFSPEAIARRQSNRTKGVKGERKVSRVRSNTYEYSGLYNEVEAQMDEADEENYTYDPVSEKKSMNEALGRLKADFDGEVSRLSEADRQWGGSDLDTAMGILHRYRTEGRATGDYGDFWRWSKVIQEKGTKGGQFIQAFAKYTRTGTGAAMKGAKDIHDRFKLNPAQQKQVDAAKKKLMDGIDGDMDGAAQDAMKQAKGKKEPTKKQDGKVDKKKLDAEVQRRKDAERLVREISKLFEKQQDHGEPVENWLNLTGEELARKIAGRFSEPKQRTKTTMQTILSDLVGFAEEHALPDRKKAEGTKRTAIDIITDYLNNRDAYGTAWAAAQSYLRAAYTDDQEKLDALNSFLTATIAYNAEGTDRTMLDAILQSADVLGISEKRILELTSAGATASTIDRIGDELVSQVKERMGANYDESFTQQLKDAVRRHITGIALQESAEEQRLRLGGMTTDAARQLELNLQKLLTQSRGDKNKAAQSVADYLIRELGIPSSDAAIAAERITGAFIDELASRADRKLQQMFAEKKPRTQEQRDRLLDLIRLGGLTNSNVEDAVVDALGIGGMSRERQRELVGAMAQFGETLDAMEENDLDGLKELIRAQAAVRNTPLSRQAEKALAGETDAQYLREFALAQLDAIAGDFAEMSPGAKISTFQTISHLLNMRTALRNLTSNQVFDLVDSAANNLATIPDMVIGAFTGKRTVGINKSWLSEMKRAGAKQGAARNALEVRLDVSPDDRQKSKYGTAGRRTNSMAASNAFGRILSHLEEVMGYELNTTDEFHKGSVRGETLESLARFVERGDITQEQANAWAEEEALYRSFQDDTLVGNFMGDLKTLLNTLAGFGDSGKTNSRGRTIHDFGLGDLVVKYTQVPGALIHRGIEYSPLGYAKMLYDLAIAKDSLVRTQKRGEDATNAQRKLALDIGRATTGSGLITLFAVLAKAGLLRRDDDDKDKNAKAMHAAQGLSGTQLNLTALKRWIEGGDLSLTDGDVLADIGFLEPLDSLMTIATLMANDDDLKLADIGVKSLDGVWKAISNTSAMQTISNIIQTVQYHDDENDLPLYFQVPIEIASDSISGFVPSPVRQLAQATDTTYRDQYRSKDLNKQIQARVMNSIPGVRQMLAPKITPLGEDRKYQKPLLNYLNATLNPGNINVYQGSGVVDELNRVYEETENANIWPERNAPYSFKAGDEKYTLTPDERTQYQRTRGQETAKFIEAVMGTNWYKAMSSESQAKILNDVGNFANYIAKKEMLDARGVEYASDDYQKLLDMYLGGATPADVMKEANKKLAGLIDAGLTEDQAKEAKGLKTDEFREYIKNQDLSDEDKLSAMAAVLGTEMTTPTGKPTQWAQLNNAVNDGLSVDRAIELVQSNLLDDYTKYADAGLTSKTSDTIVTAISKLKPEKGYDDVRDVQKWNAIISTVNDKASQEKALKTVMKDSQWASFQEVKSADVSAATYVKFKYDTRDYASTRDETTGKEIKGQTKKDKMMSYIDGLNIPDAQKDALYLVDYAESGLKDTPWHKGGGSGSGSYAPARIPTLRIPAAPTVSKPSSGLRIRAATPAAQAPRSGLRIKAQ